jgi:hypothetical protein
VLFALGRFKAVAAMFDSIRRAALPPLPAIIRGVFDGATWTCHSGAHERLARAWENASWADSTAYYYWPVAKLGQKADPVFTPCRLDAAGRAMKLLKRR